MNKLIFLSCLLSLTFGSAYAKNSSKRKIASDCQSSFQAKKLAAYILNDNLRYFGNKTVSKSNYTVQELFGDEKIENVEQLLASMEKNQALVQTYVDINNSMAGNKGLPKAITETDIKRNISSKPFCEE